jgi:hypothetical protein
MDNALLTSIEQFLRFNPGSSRKDIADGIASTVSDATLKRAIADGITKGYIKSSGKARATVYSLTAQAFVMMTYNLDTYFAKEVDERNVQTGFNFDLIRNILPIVTLFTDEEKTTLKVLQNQFKCNVSQL